MYVIAVVMVSHGALGQTEQPLPDPAGRAFVIDQPPMSPEEQRASFIVPEGFEVQLVAAEPEILKPMQLAFDERGRLLVSTSTNYPLGPLADGPPSDRVLAVEIDGATGAATCITTFAEGFDICSGVEALPGGRVILGHAPDLLLLTDTDGDGVSDDQSTLYTGFARSDTHELPNSFTWGIDGWLYGLQGHVNVSNVTDKHGNVTAIHHGNVYRLRPDGSDIEVWAPGMSNPWGLTFDGGQNLFAADCESRPLWQIVEGFPYMGFLQPEEPLGFAPHVTTDSHGASGFAGLVAYTDTVFPEAYRGNLYLGNPVNGRIHRDSIDPVGATLPLTRERDFLASTDPWFRPVDVELGPDGALYVADWYNRIIAHVEVPLDHPDRDKSRGRIWRIVYRGDGAPARGPMAVNWAEAPREDLFEALSHPNNWIRRQASVQLEHRYSEWAEEQCRARLGESEPTAVMEYLWLLQRLGALNPKDLTPLLNHESPDVRSQAVRVLGILAETDAAQSNTRLVASLADPAPRVARAAATALRRVPSAPSFFALVDTLARPVAGDTILRYAITLALREHLAVPDILREALAHEFDGDEEDTFIRILTATETPAAAEALYGYLQSGRIRPEDAPRALNTIAEHGETNLMADTFLAPELAEQLSPGALAQRARIGFTRKNRFERRGLSPEEAFGAWFPRIAEAEPALALEIGAHYELDSVFAFAKATLTEREAPEHARQLAAEFLLEREYNTHAKQVLAIVADLNEPVGARRLLALELGKRVTEQTRFDALLGALASAPAQVVAGAVESLSLARPGADLLLDAVENNRLGPVHINNHITRIRIEAAHRDEALRARYFDLVDGLEDEESVIRERMSRYRHTIQSGAERHPDRGRAIFAEACVRCHRMGGEGGMRGPNLDGLAARGIDRILQDILLPNQDIDPSFQTTIIRKTNGVVLDGQVVEEDAQRLVLVNDLNEQMPVDKSDIAKRSTIWLSPMPSDIGTALSDDDFLDLLAYLLAPETASDTDSSTAASAAADAPD